MKTNALQTIRNYNMLADGDSVTVGVSGGADSMALLYFLRFDCGLNLNLTVCHVNHMLRGAAADADAAFVETVCKTWGIPCKTRRFDVEAYSRECGVSFEQAARDVRYAFFREVAGDGKIATAHTLSDRAETLLLNLTRGCSVAGLCSIPPVRENIIRPLIDCTRTQVEAYCAEQNIDYVTDSTNFSDVYTRNRFRLQIIPALQSVNPAFYDACARLMDAAQTDEAYLQTEAERAMRNAERADGYDAKQLAALHPALCNRILANILRERDLPISTAQIDCMHRTLQTGQKANLTGTQFATVRKGIFRIETIAPLDYFEYPLDTETITLQNGDTFEIRCLDRAGFEEYKNVNKNFFFLAIDCAKMIGKRTLRQKIDGDRIHLKSRGVTKSLKKLFNEVGLSATEKSVVAVLADECGPIAVDGFGVDTRCAPDADTESFLVVRKL